MANEVYDVKNRLERSMRRYKEANLSDGFVDAFKDTPGEKAYIDGLFNGYNNGWMDAAESIVMHIKLLCRNKTKLTAKDLLSLIKFEGFER